MAEDSRLDDKGKEGKSGGGEPAQEPSQEDRCLHGVSLLEFCPKCVEEHWRTQNRDDW